ncbi:MAG: DUF2202 domain-containing protein [Methanothrix sp.]|nr:DUF2202 domain-containing protein [Methanothrix sp.]
MGASRILVVVGLLVILSGCVEQVQPPRVTETAASEEWRPDGSVGPGEYTRCMILHGPSRQGYSGGEMEICWRSDQDYIYMALNGSTRGWLALGLDPSEWMKDADMIMGYVEDGRAIVLDEYSTGNYGPHIEDEMLGGRDDILEYGGSTDGIHTIVEFKRRLDTGDRFDRALRPGESVSMIWAMAEERDPGVKHNIAYGEAILTLGDEEVAGPAVARGMQFIWEEEKTARDLYISLYRETNLSIFMELVRSEQSHMDQVRGLMERHGVSAPLPEEPGVLENQTLIQIYNELLTEGRRSGVDALRAAATFEEVSIIDLKRELAATKDEDIRAVYQGLLAGSRKHLRSYVADLREEGIDYSPKHLDRAEFDEIIR